MHSFKLKIHKALEDGNDSYRKYLQDVGSKIFQRLRNIIATSNQLQSIFKYDLIPIYATTVHV